MNEKDLISESQLDDAIDRLTLEVEPDRDLWPAVQAKLNQPDATPWVGNPDAGDDSSRYWPIAATVLLVAMGALLFSQQVIEPPLSPPMSNSGFGPAMAHPSEMDALSDTRDAMLATLQGATADLSDAAREDIARSLEGLRAGREDVEAALAASPNDPFLQDMRVAITYEELAMIQAMTDIASTAIQRT